MAIAWKRYLTEVSNEYPLLDLLEADFPALVRAVRCRGAEAKNFADQERRKREANPQFKASRAYRRAARQAAKKKAAAKEKFDTLMGAAGLGPWAVGRPPTNRSERPPMWGDGLRFPKVRGHEVNGVDSDQGVHRCLASDRRTPPSSSSRP